MAMDEEVEVTEETSGEDTPHIFLDKSSLGDKRCKPGDTLTLKVVDVDSESGDVEATLEGYDHKGGDKGYMAEFDEAMPEEESEMV